MTVDIVLVTDCKGIFLGKVSCLNVDFIQEENSSNGTEVADSRYCSNRTEVVDSRYCKAFEFKQAEEGLAIKWNG